jgi:hypothetical protein
MKISLAILLSCKRCEHYKVDAKKPLLCVDGKSIVAHAKNATCPTGFMQAEFERVKTGESKAWFESAIGTCRACEHFAGSEEQDAIPPHVIRCNACNSCGDKRIYITRKCPLGKW